MSFNAASLSSATQFKEGFSAYTDAMHARQMPSGKVTKDTPKEKIIEQAKEFEAVFLNTMLTTMFSTLKGDGPFGGKDTATSSWRDMMVDQYARALTDKGGIGISDQITKELLHIQEQQGA
jgi:peptidoglycan hydrolase FlgJ